MLKECGALVENVTGDHNNKNHVYTDKFSKKGHLRTW